MHFRKIAAACALAGALLPGAVWAEDSGFYIGASIGQATQEFSGFEGDDTALELFGGWSFNEYLAVEGGYVDSGTQSDSLGQFDVDISSDGFFVEGIARWPLGKYVAPYVKLGYVFYDATTKVTSPAGGFSESESDSDIMYGGGLEFMLGENFRLRAEYEEVNLPDSAFDIISLGATWHF